MKYVGYTKPFAFTFIQKKISIILLIVYYFSFVVKLLFNKSDKVICYILNE